MKFELLIIASISLLISCQGNQTTYVCPPCKLDCDILRFKEPGNCPHCNMTLVSATSLEEENELTVNEIHLEQGSGKFLVEGGVDKTKTVVVHYYRPANFDRSSEVIIVLPGAGRNGNDYRDAWIEASKKYGVLVLSLEYSEEHYPGFWSYNLGGMITNVNIDTRSFDINPNATTWIFNDFDRIFNLVKEEFNLKITSYDLFGHSAGGQILHRMAIFKPKSQANRILAANSGWYTLPTKGEPFPYGLGDSSFTELEPDFDTHLILFLGEKDDANETRGHLRHGPVVDKQGLHRLARGKYFYDLSKNLAKSKGNSFKWKLEVIDDVGHDYKLMSVKAADYLFSKKV